MSTLTVGTIQSNTTAPPAVTNSGGTEIGTFCRAWVNFDGTGTFSPNPSTTKIRASFNVSSILDNGTGDYTVNFTTAMPDANFVANVSSNNATNVPSNINGAMTTSSFRFTHLEGGVAGDVSQLHLSFFR